MPKLFGYNQWPDQWPPDVPVSIRYPRVMLKNGPFPYNWKCAINLVGPNWPDPGQGKYVATFRGVFLGDYLYDVFPSFLGPPTLTFLTVRLMGTLDRPTGIRYIGSIQGQFPDKYPNAVWTKEYEIPYDYDRLYQAESFGLFFHDPENPITDFASFDFWKPSYCGEEWP